MCKLLLHPTPPPPPSPLYPPPITSPSICITYSASPYTPVRPGTAARGPLPTVFPSAALARSCQFQILSNVSTRSLLQEDAATRPTEAVGRVSGVPRDTSRRPSSRAATSFPLVSRVRAAKAPLHVRCVSSDVLSLHKKKGNKGKCIKHAAAWQ